MEDFEIITINKPNITDFALERNKLLAKAKKDWVFFVDSDEEVSSALYKEIETAIKKKSHKGFYVIRRDFFFGRELKHGEFSKSGWFGNTKILRLARKDAGIWERAVHEFWNVQGPVGILKNPLFHYSHPNLKDFIKSIDHFSTLHATALKKEGKRSNLAKIMIWSPGKFLYNYIFRLGFLDGMQGFIAALIMSFHSFLSWSKLYFLRS